MSSKQIILIRKDLKMRRGKECSMASHAAMGFISQHLHKRQLHTENPNGGYQHTITLSDEEAAWFDNGTAKITLQVADEAEMLAVVEKAKAAGLNTYVVVDEGLTEFNGVHTRTAAAIGPHYEEKFVGITDHLKLY